MKTTILSMLLAFASLSSFAQRDNDDDYPHHKKSSNEKYGKNILAFSPLNAISNNNVGVGISYERLVNDYVGIRIPVMAGLNQPYVNIGIEAKLYPTKNNNRPVKYAIAPALTFGTGQVWDGYYYTNQNGLSNRYYTNRAHFGFLLNQTINFTIMENFYLGIDGGLGINYYDNENNYNYNNNSYYNNNTMTFLAQFSMMIGVRF